MKIPRDELRFYVAVIIGVIIIETANTFGAGICVFPPVLLGILFIGWKTFPAKHSNK